MSLSNNSIPLPLLWKTNYKYHYLKSFKVYESYTIVYGNNDQYDRLRLVTYGNDKEVPCSIILYIL